MQAVRQSPGARPRTHYGPSSCATLHHRNLLHVPLARSRLPKLPVVCASMGGNNKARARAATLRSLAPPSAPPPALAAWLRELEQRGRVRGVTARAAAPAAAAPSSAAAAPSSAAAAPAAPAILRSAASKSLPPLEERTLLHQRIAVRRARYAAPEVVLPQASQLVGLIFSVLGPPTFSPPVPGVRHPNSEGKYELLRLLWRRAERAAALREAAASPGAVQQTAEEYAAAAAAAAAEDAAREQELCAALTVHLRVSLGRVFEDARVPPAAREVAAARLREREANVKAGIAAWFSAALARPDLDGVLLPLLRAVVGALEARGGFVPDAQQQQQQEGRGGPASAASGERMEAAAAALVGAQLPDGWSLLPNAHIVALDGRHPGHRASCKWEADFFVLDAEGRAVALFEAKCALANPLMTLLTDAERCVALVDELRGASNVTLRVCDDGGGGRVIREAGGIDAGGSSSTGTTMVAGGENRQFSNGSGSASGGSGSSSDDDDDDESAANLSDGSDGRAAIALRRKQRKAAAAAAKAADKKRWRDVTVPVVPGLRPVYVLGRPLRRKDLRRGLSSAATAEALKLAAARPAALAAALAAAAAAAPSHGSSSNSSDGVGGGYQSPTNLASAASSELSSAPGSDDGLLSDGELSSSSSLSSEAGSVSAAAAADGDPVRLAVRLPPEWREEIAAKVLARLDLITDRCTVLALDDGSGGGGGAGGI